MKSFILRNLATIPFVPAVLYRAVSEKKHNLSILGIGISEKYFEVYKLQLFRKCPIYLKRSVKTSTTKEFR